MIKFEPKILIVCYFPILSFVGGEWIHVPNSGHRSFGPVCMELWVLKKYKYILIFCQYIS